jgi:hypothetical protein
MGRKSRLKKSGFENYRCPALLTTPVRVCSHHDTHFPTADSFCVSGTRSSMIRKPQVNVFRAFSLWPAANLP